MSRKPLNLDGQKFGDWIVLSTEIKLCGKKTNSICTCRCSCGKIKEVRATFLKKGRSSRCKSCASREKNKKHSKSYTDEYKIYIGIKKRCYNPNSTAFNYYGDRGIKVCDRWLESFENFLEDMGDRPSKNHSIDRIDVNGDYSPKNCRWADNKTQMRNRKNTKIINYKGLVKPISQFCEELALPYRVVYERIKMGWSVEKAFTTPVRVYKK